MTISAISDPFKIQLPPLCNVKTLKEEWEQKSVQKKWGQKVHAWISFESAPPYGKKQNHFELLGVTLLIPCSLWLGVFLIKYPQDADLHTLTLQKATALFLITITLPITLLGVLIKGFGEILPHKKIECDDSSKTKTHPLIVEACYLMTEQFVKACDAISFERYYPLDGTLLGAVRHGGFIPWDDDVDLGVDEADIPRLRKELKPLLEAQGIVWAENLYESFTVIKLSFSSDRWKRLIEDFQEFNPDQSIPAELMAGSPNIIDLCANAIMSNGSWASASSAGRAMFPMDYVPFNDEMEKAAPAQYIPFGLTLLPTFSNETIIRYLKTYYGDDCLTHGLQTHSHGSINTYWGRIPVPKFYRTYRFKITNSNS
jgi:hypothetical protein